MQNSLGVDSNSVMHTLCSTECYCQLEDSSDDENWQDKVSLDVRDAGGVVLARRRTC